MRIPILLIALACSGAMSIAQNESRFHSDVRREVESLSDCTKTSTLMYCGQTIFLGQPFHLAAGSLSPDNGIGVGLALVEHKNFANELRTSFNFDVVATTNNSWRAGGYMKAYKLPSGNQYRVAPLFYLYAQSTSLNRVDYFGLGPSTTRATHTTYGFSETIAGADMAIPISIHDKAPAVAIVAELNGRFPSVRAGNEKNIPSIGALFTDSTAPGLGRQRVFIEPAVGVRLFPSLFSDTLRINYLLQIQQFVAAGDSTNSFRRFNADFNHEIPIARLSKSLGKYYDQNRAAVLPHNGPDDCTGAGREKETMPCPKVSLTRKLQGSINFRAFISESFANSRSRVPFYFMPTIGGSDLNGTALLPSYPDYRFRGPDLLLFRGTVEHSLGKLPIGATFSVDEGKIGMRRDDISLDHFRHSFSTGLTVHAGGVPLISFVYTWGGNEGSHTIGSISPTLLGSSSRPSLF